MNNQVIRQTFTCSIFFSIFCSPAWALNWTAQPSLNLEQIYSDNILQTSSNQKAAFVTELSPGLSLNSNSSISTFNLNYRMQNLYNSGAEGKVDINHQLQMDTQYEFVHNKLFADSSSSISQQNVSNRRTATDNISGGNSSTTVSTFKLSPYWTPHFKGYADGEFRVTYDRTDSKGGEASELSKTNSLSQNISLRSGREFSLVSWSLDFNNSNRNNSNSDNVSFQDSSVEIRYAVRRYYSLFVRAGQSSNSFASNSDNNNNGISYTFGGQWQPSHRFRLEAGYGNNRFVTVEISPFNRLHWTTTYSNNDIGLNANSKWDTALNYTTRRSTWTASYNEQTVTTQQLLLDQQVFVVTDDFDEQNTNIVSSQDFRFNTRLPSLTDEVFITKNAALNVSFKTGKSTVSANIFRIIRDFEQSGNEEKVTGLSASWDWQFIRRTSAVLRSSWQETTSDGINSFSDQQFDISFGITRNILSRLNGKIEYQFVDQSSDDDLNTYTENRITASLILQF